MKNELLFFLFLAGADVNSIDENGCRALHLAAWNGHFDIASALISHDPRQETINALTKNQESALHFAAQYGHGSIVALLLRVSEIYKFSFLGGKFEKVMRRFVRCKRTAYGKAQLCTLH